MYFKRDIWDKLVFWKNEWKSLSLEVHGARQVGKTFILKRFCQEEFRKFIYVNMAEKSGKDFLACVSAFGKESKLATVYEMLKMYDAEYEDTPDTVILIDEIQESSEVYNLIRNFTHELKARFIVTGSYLGKILDRDFFLPAGDIAQLTMYPLSFPEFLDIFGLREVQCEYGKKNRKNDRLMELFNVYVRLGGYPAVVAAYLESNNYDRCMAVLEFIIETFVSESSRYFTEVEDFSAFRDLLLSIAALAMKEKQGTNLIEDISKIMLRRGTNRISKNAIASAISWLRASGIVDYATKLVDGDPQNVISNARFYFSDVGMASYFALSTGMDPGTVKGFLAENYVYIALRNKFYLCSIGKGHREVTGWQPSFATYGKTGGELDFIVCGRLGGRKYGIEVKAGKNRANTGRAMLADGKIDHLYVLEGSTHGGEIEGITTMPICLADQLDLAFGTEERMKLISF